MATPHPKSRPAADVPLGERVAPAPEKEKLSLTLDRALVDEIRKRFDQRALSASINDLLHAALIQDRLGQLVEDLEQEAGPASVEAHQRVLAQWFAEG